ncbi:AMIN domain-containing protein [Thermomonas fusca]|uniref:N-acetylmuramoyl-L-alanine amidase AmiC n=2 Tax=Thermomonas fusca TaxID=215690 RepID=A0A5R9PFX7_9GAMM|nr:AMIN domain-containing protein [Thermomonas fusca]
MGNRCNRVLPAAMLLAAFACSHVNASEIKQLRIETGATGTRAELHLDKAGEYRLIPLSNPERLAVDFPSSHLARGLALPAAAGMVKAVRTGQPVPGTVRVVFDLASKVRAIPTTLDTAASGTVLVLEWPGDPAPASVPATAAAATPAVATTEKPVTADPAPSTGTPAGDPIAAFATAAMPTQGVPAKTTVATTPTPPPAASPSVQQAAPDVPAPRPLPQAGTRPLVVAIDAGHGGQDPGAHGPNGTREKDITLAIARELARQVNATPGLKAFLTRDSDMYIPLNHRARRASANRADIFLSIHADAAENRGARGSSVYVLSTRGASSQRARWLADKENAADIIGGERVRVADNTLTSVLLDLTQSGNMKASEDAAEHVLGGLKRVGNNHKPDVERANFAVLRTSDKMPAMLVETAFISNPDEEKRLADPAFQRTLASAILDGVDRYFSRQPPPGTLYAARAQARQSAQIPSGGRTLDIAAVGAGGSP